MSASLDDMPAYEHFQDELDLELMRYSKQNSISDTHIENVFIQYICFDLFLSNPSEITSEILEHFLNKNENSEEKIMHFLLFVHQNEKSFLKNSLVHIFNFRSK